MVRRFLHIHRSPLEIGSWIKAGLGAAVAFAVALGLGDLNGAKIIVAPMAASAAIIFGLPNNPAAQPAHVILGHLLAAILALASNTFLTPDAWVVAGTIGVVITLLGILHLNHPPAAATALLVLFNKPGWGFLLTPLLTGLVTLVLVAVLIHRLPPRTVYPMAVPEPDRPGY